MRKILLLLIILVINKSFGQNRLNGIIVDSDTKNPIEYVDIYNTTNFTSTNSEGEFLFVSEQDSVKINLLGYKPIYSIFEKFKKDTIFLESKFETLDEIILGNSNSITNVYKELHNNYPFTPYSESFFLRCFLKKDGVIVKLQDLNGLVKRKTLFSTSKNPMPKKNYEIEILNMRKAGIKEKDIYFKMFSFKQILDFTASVGINTKLYDFKETKSENDEYTRYHFSPKTEKKSKREGYYLVNNKDKAIVEFKSKNISTKGSFEEMRGIKYRTISFEYLVSFKKNIIDNIYFLDKAKIIAQVEVIAEDKSSIYDVVYSWITLSKTKKEVDKNTSVKKDIFKLNKSFNSEFWNKQEHLLLTNELSEFLKKLENSQNKFKTVTNIKQE
ncbi:MAG: hypothetical protein COB81_10850 [Flavobacteriaceae bacterium]|nr:MAG: hypothetical protein COB81_10850 [Flavobacteriaceae bacterium]